MNSKIEKKVVKDWKSSIKHLMSGEIHLVNVKELKKELLLNPCLGDRLQYELHNYCKINSNNFSRASLVEELSLLCYSEKSVSQFSNLDRFLGCVYYISSYLLKSEKYSAALFVVNSLDLKKEEIEEAAKSKGDLRNIFCSLHSLLMSEAVKLASKVKNIKEKCYETSHKLAVASLKVFLFSKTQVPGVEKKIFKTTRLYFFTINHYKNENILEIYNLLQQVLMNILPNFNKLDFIIFHLLRLDQDVKTIEASQVSSHFNKIINITSLVLEFSPSVVSALTQFLNLFLSLKQDYSILDSDSFIDLFTTSSSCNLFFIIIITIFNCGIQLWWDDFESNKSSKANSLECICKIFKRFILEFYGCFDRHVCIHHSSSELEVCLSDVIVGSLHKIQYSCRLLLKHKCFPENYSLISLAQEAFKLALNCIRIMENNGCSQKQRNNVWRPTIIHHTNLVEDILKYSNQENWWLELRDCSHEVLLEIFKTEYEVPYDYRRIIILFKRWHFANLKLKAFNDCFYVCLAYYIAFPQKESDVMLLWTQTKAESCNEIIQEVTVAETFKNWNQSLKYFNKSNKSTESILKSLLLMELKAYIFCSWKTFQDATIGFKVTKKVWEKLRKYEPDLWERSFGLCALIATNTFANGRFPPDFQKECGDFIQYLINWKCNGKTQCRSLLHAANLKFFLFLHKLKEAEAQEEQINSSNMVLDYLKKVEEEKLKLGENVDLNLSCDVISSSAYLTVGLESSYLEGLDEVVKLWEKAISGSCDVVPTLVEYEMWQQTMKHAAHFYVLIGEYRRSLMVWLLYYKLGKLRNDPFVILLGLSYLIKCVSDVDESPLLKEALDVSSSLQADGKEKSVLAELWLSLASNYFKNKRENECLDYLVKAKEVIGCLGSAISSSHLSARFWCLVSKFLCVYPERDEAFGYPSGTDLRLPVFRAFSCANMGARSNLIRSVAQGECMELIIVMLQVNLWAFYFYEIYRKTDYMRLFLDDLYQILQRLNLPTRTAELLLRLAEVDMIREKVTECRGKLIKVKSILKTFSSKCVDFKQKPALDSPPLFDLNDSEIEAAALRPVSPARFLHTKPDTNCDLSPAYIHLSDVNQSKSLGHVKSCDCRLCKNILIQLLTINAQTLEGQIHETEKSQKDAVVAFKQVSEGLINLKRITNEQTQSVGENLCLVFGEKSGNVDLMRKSVQFFSARFLIKYGFFEIGAEKKVTSNLLKLIEKINGMMKQISYKEKLLLWTFTELKTVGCFLQDSSNKKLPPKVATEDARSRKFSETSDLESPVVYKTVGDIVTPLPTHASKHQLVKTKFKESIECGSSKSSNEETVKKNESFPPLKEKDELVSAKILKIRPTKLVFDSVEPSKTVIKVPTKKVSVIKPKKLDFDKPETGEEKKESVPLKARNRVLEKQSTGRRKCESLIGVKKDKCSGVGTENTKPRVRRQK